MFTTMLQKGAIAEFHVRFQDNWMQTMYVNVQSIKKD
jgi:hypothetical protein